jgi:hypothetical protein
MGVVCDMGVNGSFPDCLDIVLTTLNGIKFIFYK